MEPWEQMGPQFKDPLGISEPEQLVPVTNEPENLPDQSSDDSEGRGQE